MLKTIGVKSIGTSPVWMPGARPARRGPSPAGAAQRRLLRGAQSRPPGRPAARAGVAVGRWRATSACDPRLGRRPRLPSWRADGPYVGRLRGPLLAYHLDVEKHGGVGFDLRPRPASSYSPACTRTPPLDPAAPGFRCRPPRVGSLGGLVRGVPKDRGPLCARCLIALIVLVAVRARRRLAAGATGPPLHPDPRADLLPRPRRTERGRSHAFERQSAWLPRFQPAGVWRRGAPGATRPRPAGTGTARGWVVRVVGRRR